MPIRTSPYNDSSIGALFQNAASALAPPSGSDLAGYSTAGLNAEKKREISALFDLANNPNVNHAQFDQVNSAVAGNALTGGYAGIDADLAKNANTVRGSVITGLFGKLGQGEMTPGVSADIAGTVGLPALPGAQGLPKPLSETEWQAQQNQRLLGSGQLTDQNLVDAVLGKDTPVKAVGPAGTDVYMSPGEAVRTGAPVPQSDTQRQAPNGYRWTADGNLEFIPHGPADPSTAGKTTEATRRNQQLASVITPELHALLGDGTPQNPGTFDSLSNGVDIAKANTPGAQMLGVGPSGAFQQAQNSLRTIIASYLYSVSGATANPGEVENLMSTLTPKINEDPASVAGKKARLQQMVEAVQAAATGAPFTADKPVPDAPAGAAPQPGEVVDGYTFKGGDPADQNNWTANP